MGCAGPTLVIRGDEIQAQGFQAISVKGENKTFVYKPWYQIGFLDTVINALAGLVGGAISSPTKKVEADTEKVIGSRWKDNTRNQKFGFPYDLK